MFLLFTGFNIPLEADGTEDRNSTTHTLFKHTDSIYLDKRLENLENFLDKLRSKKDRFKSPIQFVEYVFHKTHNRYLKMYSKEATIEDLFKNGTYNCLTGTALYALIFEQLGINYYVIELDHHTYLKISMDNRIIMIESTDPLNGVVTDPVKYMELDKELYSSSKKEKYYKYNKSIRNVIHIDQLVGLLYFNQAAVKYNNKMFLDAYNILQIAKVYYPGSRMDEFEALIIKKLSQEEIAYMQ